MRSRLDDAIGSSLVARNNTVYNARVQPCIVLVKHFPSEHRTPGCYPGVHLCGAIPLHHYPSLSFFRAVATALNTG